MRFLGRFLLAAGIAILVLLFGVIAAMVLGGIRFAGIHRLPRRRISRTRVRRDWSPDLHSHIDRRSLLDPLPPRKERESAMLSNDSGTHSPAFIATDFSDTAQDFSRHWTDPRKSAAKQLLFSTTSAEFLGVFRG